MQEEAARRARQGGAQASRLHRFHLFGWLRTAGRGSAVMGTLPSSLTHKHAPSHIPGHWAVCHIQGEKMCCARTAPSSSSNRREEEIARCQRAPVGVHSRLRVLGRRAEQLLQISFPRAAGQIAALLARVGHVEPISETTPARIQVDTYTCVNGREKCRCAAL